MPSLDDRLVASRTQLLDEISQPDLGRIAKRAGRLRRGRVAGRTGATLLALVAIGSLVARSWTGDRGTPLPAATPEPTPQTGVVYTDAGITVNGLVPDRRVIDVRGKIRDVEFVDPDHGWVLTADCPATEGTCVLNLAGTADGGLTWQIAHLTPAAVPDLVPLDENTVVLHGAGTSMVSTDGGARWQPVTPDRHPVDAAEPDARLLLRTGPAGGCPGAVVEAWSPGYGYRGDLAVQPPIHACWIAAAPASDGAWWVGGTASGAPAVAATRDGGRTWQAYPLPGGSGDRAELAMLGSDVYAVVVSGQPAPAVLRAIYRSTDAGPFVRTWAGAGPPGTIGGQPVPLLDGRLLVSNGLGSTAQLGAWYVSDDRGATFAPAHELPQIGVVRRTVRGYVAFDIVADGWVAYSSDGATWRKLHLH